MVLAAKAAGDLLSWVLGQVFYQQWSQAAAWTPSENICRYFLGEDFKHPLENLSSFVYFFTPRFDRYEVTESSQLSGLNQ